MNNIRKIIFQKSQKDDYLVKIKELSGYGGLIHFYKDYLELKDEKLINKIQSKHSALLKVIKSYDKFDGTTQEEKEFLKTLQNTFDLMISNAYDISQAENKVSSSIEKIDNKNAINAIDRLSNSIYGANSDWREKSTNKINLLNFRT